MDHRRWTMDGGRWTMDDGRWTVDDGQWTMDEKIKEIKIKDARFPPKSASGRQD